MERQEIYKNNITKYSDDVKTLSGKIVRMSLIRIAIFIASAVGIYFLWPSTFWTVAILFFFFVSFLFLVKKHTELKEERNKIKILIDLNSKEIDALKGNYNHFDGGDFYNNPSHAFAQDIDLFGKRSFFQYLNRTGLRKGQDFLANMLNSNEVGNIKIKQGAVKELAGKLDFRQNFTADALMLTEQDKLDNVINSLTSHENFVPKSFRLVSLIFSILSLVVVFLYAFEVIGEMQLILWIFVGLGITGAFLKKVNNLSIITSKAQEIFRQYQKLIFAVENEDFQSELLKNKQTDLKLKDIEISKIIRQLSKHIDSLEQRQNFLVGFVLNALFLWDLRQSFKIERWLDDNSESLKKWFDTIAEFDAFNSLGNLAYNQTEFCFPEIDYEAAEILKCKAGSHPLILKKQAIANDFLIRKEDFLIITGANMAGKSTFLRTVSLMIVMSNNGLPVCAESLTYKPIKLITSMRTSDSLSDESSYFYAELSRLKSIVAQINKDEYFIVLDEILKGTNSHDKAKGSQQFIEKLVRTKCSGIIATHDLSLCSLSDKLESVHNHYFDAEIKNDELYFDYKFKEGICQNMNASFLLKKMGIV